MVKTPSTMSPLGTYTPHFSLPEPSSGEVVSLSDFAEAPALLVMFLSNHCPFVKHIADQIADFGRDYRDKGLAIVAINSNDVANYPDDSPEKMKAEAAQWGYTFPYLYDEDQSVARAYDAACTPDFYLFDADMKLVYRGQLDASRPGNGIPVTGADLRGAIDAILAGETLSDDQTPSIGCNIKWRAGHEPDYFNPSGAS